MGGMNSPLNYQPSAFYFRHELTTAKTKREAVQIGLRLVRELEAHKEWIRAQGFIPPKFYITQSEAHAKGWGSVVPFPSTAPSSATAE